MQKRRFVADTSVEGISVYFPDIISARLVKQFSIGTCRAVLVSDCVSIGPIHYTYALYFRDHDDPLPLLCMASEIADDDPSQEKRFLCRFYKGVHSNFGPSIDWLDLEKFLPVAFSIAAETLGIAGQPVELPLETEPGFLLRFLPPLAEADR